MSTQCFYCGRADADNQVDEVWFDFGEPVMRFCSSRDLFRHDSPPPRMCGEHKKAMAHSLAERVLDHAVEAGATGPLWPARWWVRYADGHVIGGDVRPRPGGVEASACVKVN